MALFPILKEPLRKTVDSGFIDTVKSCVIFNFGEGEQTHAIIFYLLHPAFYIFFAAKIM